MQGSWGSGWDQGWLDTADRAAIADLMARFAHAIDRCDWVAYRSVFTDEIELDYSSWRAGSIGTWNADDWVARAGQLFPGLTGTQHALTNLLIEAGEQPGTARVRASVRADHAFTDPDGSTRMYTLYGYYDDHCERTSDGWRIRGKRLVVEWDAGDASLMAAARDRAAADPHPVPRVARVAEGQ